ncbi:hypothetical protein A8B78_06000 [Jannaschia sp. EhC01]|nr:hypothetical protein A8B78_06000 [Jannaschia sp. EhC01]
MSRFGKGAPFLVSFFALVPQPIVAETIIDLPCGTVLSAATGGVAEREEEASPYDLLILGFAGAVDLTPEAAADYLDRWCGYNSTASVGDVFSMAAQELILERFYTNQNAADDAAQYRD